MKPKCLRQVPCISHTWAPRCFTLPVTINCFYKKDIYVILIHILGRERCICCLWSFVNLFAFVSKHIEIFQDQIQMQCVAYPIVKTLHDELSICCITFAFVYNKLFTFISLHSNWIVSLGIFSSLAYVNRIFYNVN
jgi:hypothetical protein